jgi:hypothetical protein
MLRHRGVLLLLGTLLLGIFLAVPGWLIAALFWPAGVHSVTSTDDAIAMLAVIFGVSLVAWAALLNLLLPRAGSAQSF